MCLICIYFINIQLDVYICDTQKISFNLSAWFNDQIFKLFPDKNSPFYLQL